MSLLGGDERLRALIGAGFGQLKGNAYTKPTAYHDLITLRNVTNPRFWTNFGKFAQNLDFVKFCCIG